jgi:adenine-specific DNA-methyltransferase
MASTLHTTERRKQLGAFYTPHEMAAKLVKWAIRDPDDSIIDPSFGGFVFLELAKERLLSLGDDPAELRGLIFGVDMDEEALRIAREEEGLGDVSLIQSDFFDVEPDDLPCFSANIGNPPYIRYQSWDGDGSPAHDISKQMGVKLSRLSSIWAPFILHGCRFLKQGGRLGQVLPAELMHAQYARPVTDYLTRSFREVTVVVFEERVFPGALEEIVLLFADGFGEGPARGIGVVACRDLGDLDLSMIDGKGRGYFDADLALLRLLPQKSQRLYDRLAADSRVQPLGALAEVDIGAVTGANDFFIRQRKEIRSRRFPAKLFQTIIGKANDIPGAALTDDDVAGLVERGRKTELLVANGTTTEKQKAALAELIAEGEALGLPSRYKCRIRTPWWSVPLPKRGAPDAFLTYMNDAFPRLVANEAGALSTNTIHNVALLDSQPPAALAVAFYNSLTLLSAELVGRSYGGGILKLEPTEAERLLLPPFSATLAKHLPKLDRLIRQGNIEAVLNFVDPLVLTPLGVTEADIRALRLARQKLYGRRRSRSSKKTR